MRDTMRVKYLSIRMAPEEVAALRQMAEDNGVSLQSLCREALQRLIEKGA